MALRYVRVQSQSGRLHYGLLQPDRSVLVLDAPPWLEGQPTDQQLSPAAYVLLAPCAPSKILAVGSNYTSVDEGSGGSLEPLLFIKPSTAVVACGAPILYPPHSKRVDYEGELAIVIGKRTFDCSPETAAASIWGYTIANDVTARDLQLIDGQWTRAKGYDTFCPLGPWIVREISPGAQLQTFVNNAQPPAQSASIDAMILSPSALVSYISQVMTLLPGDVILTGSPQGAGPMHTGDTVRIEIEGIGALENIVIHRTAQELNG